MKHVHWRSVNRSFAPKMDCERLEKACYRGDMEAIEEMYSMATPLEFAQLYSRDGRYLCAALDGGQWAVAQFLLAKHFHVSNEAVAKAGACPPALMKEIVASSPRQGLGEALSFAALAGSEENIKIILDSQKRYLNRALASALSMGHTGCAQILLDAGADVNGVDTSGKPVMAQALENEMGTRFLLERGARTEGAVERAIMYGHLGGLRALLSFSVELSPAVWEALEKLCDSSKYEEVKDMLHRFLGAK